MRRIGRVSGPEVQNLDDAWATATAKSAETAAQQIYSGSRGGRLMSGQSRQAVEATWRAGLPVLLRHATYGDLMALTQALALVLARSFHYHRHSGS